MLTEDGMFAESASLERKFCGFQLFSMFLPEISSDHISELFHSNFLRCLANHASNNDRYLNKAAKKAVYYYVNCPDFSY